MSWYYGFDHFDIAPPFNDPWCLAIDRMMITPDVSVEVGKSLKMWPEKKSKEKDGSTKLEIKVPGYNKSHISLELKGTELRITLDKKEDQKKTVLNYSLGADTDSSKITASCKDGILTILFPLLASEQPRTIPVE